MIVASYVENLGISRHPTLVLVYFAGIYY